MNGTTTVFVTDPEDREVLEYDGAAGTIQRWFVYGGGLDEVLAQVNVAAAYTTSNPRLAMVPDIQGSVIGTIDAGSGTITKAGYAPFGESGTTAGTYRYTGRRIDAETGGLYYYRARTYDPVAGRFLQADPIGYGGGLNRYAYVNNDPLNLVDPFGLTSSPNRNVAAANFGGAGAIAALGLAAAFTGDAVPGAMLLATAGVVAVSELVATAVAPISAELTALSTRANQIRNVVDPIAQQQRTVSILRTDSGDIVASGVRDLTQAQRAALQPGEIAAKLPGAHAEITALNAAQQTGLVPRLLVTTQEICPACARAIESLGGVLTSGTTVVFPPH